jgi:hypothetical protein
MADENWIYVAYDKAWGNDPDRDKITRRLDKLDPNIVANILRNTVQKMDSNRQNAFKWAKFKMDVLETSPKEMHTLFLWKTSEPRQRPIGVDLDWPHLSQLAPVPRLRTMYLIWLELTGNWFGPELPSIWYLLESDSSEKDDDPDSWFKDF